MNKKIVLLFCLIFVALFCIGTVCATKVTMRVDSKHIVGIGSGNTPIDMDGFANPMYVISEREKGTSAHYIIQEYPVSIEDYANIQVGQTVTLEIPDSRIKACKVIEII